MRVAGPTWGLNVPRKPDSAGGGGSPPTAAARVPAVLSKTPTLASYLLDLQYEGGGGPREPSYLLIRAAAGEWLLTLKDPTEVRQLRTRVTDLGTAWASLEALLASDCCPWEPDIWASRGKAGGRKKGG
jgi:hypothetical protein